MPNSSIKDIKQYIYNLKNLNIMDNNNLEQAQNTPTTTSPETDNQTIYSTQTNTWQGRVVIKKGLFPQHRYAIIDKTGIKIYKKEHGEIELEIPTESISSIKPPKTDIIEIFFSGYSGYCVTYKVNDKTASIKFWPKGFGAMENSAQTPAFSRALSLLSNSESETTALKESKPSNSALIIILAAIFGFLGYFLFGALGVIILVLALYLCYWIYKRENLSPAIKAISITGIIVFTLILIIAIQVLLVIFLLQ